MNELIKNPCPFCGSRDVDVLENIEYAGSFAVSCNQCDASGPSVSSVYQAIAKWDIRHLENKLSPITEKTITTLSFP